jgi:hypothetical protein
MRNLKIWPPHKQSSNIIKAINQLTQVFGDE